MSYKNDFIRVLRNENTTPVPFSVKFTVEAAQKYEAWLGRKPDLIADTGSYVVASHTNNGWQEVKPGFFRDYFGVVWNKTVDKTLGVADNPPLKGAGFGDYTFPNPDNIPVYDFIRQNNVRYPDRFHMVSIGFTLFERAWSLTGMENLMMYLMVEPDFVHDMLDRITEYNIKVIENAASLGIDCVHFGDDWGAQNGLLIGADMWREFIKPRFARTCAAAHAHGLPVSLHSCGKVDELFPDMIACGVDVFDPFQPETMDVYALREQYRNQLAFWGGLSVQQTLPYGTPEQVRNQTRRLLTEMAPGGGYILAPSHSLTGDIPIDNILAFLDVARTQTEN